MTVADAPYVKGMHPVEETMAVNFPKMRDISREGTSAFVYAGLVAARDHQDDTKNIVQMVQRNTVANSWFPAYNINDDSFDIHLVRRLP